MGKALLYPADMNQCYFHQDVIFEQQPVKKDCRKERRIKLIVAEQ
jgi:hypothetical protein